MKDKRKKVLFLINTLKGGGAEKVLVDTVNNLDSNKYQITVQTVIDEGVYQTKLSSDICYKTIISSKNPFIKKVLLKLMLNVLGTKRVYNLFVRDEYDYEIAFLEGVPTKIIAESTNKRAKKIAWVHIDLLAFPDSYRAYGSEKKEETAYHCFDKIFCVSDAVRDSLLMKYSVDKNNVLTLYNILDDQAILNASQEDVELPTDIKPCFISVGRMTEQKGYDRLLRVHKRLIDEGYVHSLLIVGEGDKRSDLEEYIKENDLKNSAFLVGFQTNPYKYISRADLFVCSSYAEGFSTVISESVLCGTPIIATDVSGNREPVVCPRCSIVVENSEDALYEGLMKVLKESALIEQYAEELVRKQDFFKKKQLVAEFEKAVFIYEE